MKRIFITGASSGIGEALARVYAEPGVVLGLGARRLERLEALKTELGASARLPARQGAEIHVYRLDVTDTTNVTRVAAQFLKEAGGIDLVIANAGIAGWVDPARGDVETMTAMVDTNVNGVIRTLTAFIPAMVKQRSGQLVAMSSIAGFAALPGGVYSATKAAVRYLMDSWAGDLGSYGIQTTTVFPGFVSSEITRGERYPFLISAEAAATQIKAGIGRGQRWLILPWQWRLLVPILRLLPPSFFAWFRRVRIGRQPDNQAPDYQ